MTQPVNPIVEMQVDGEWVDITADCRQGSADSGGGYEIARGIPNEGAFAEPTQFNFTLNNGISKAPDTAGQSGVYSPTNPMGPYFGLLGRNQRVRVGLDRRTETWVRTPGTYTAWGDLPDSVHADGTTVVEGERWNYYGSPSAFAISGGAGTITAGSTIRAAMLNKPYRDADILMRFAASNLTSEIGFFARMAPFVVPYPSGLGSQTDTGWAVTNGTLAVDSSVKMPGYTSSLRLTVVGAPASSYINPNNTASTMWYAQGAPNFDYYMRMWVRSSVTTTVRIACSWYNEAASTFISSSTADHAVTANTWTSIDLTVTAPPQNAGYIRLYAGFPTSPTAGWQLWIQDPEIHDTTNAKWYSATLVPGTPDVLRLGKKAKGSSNADNTTSPIEIVANTKYWLRAQIMGQRTRIKLWADGAAEPTAWGATRYDDRTIEEDQPDRTGQMGVLVNGGSAVVTIDSIQIDQWRAHTEIAQLPPRFDLSRRDHWVQVQSRGILRRLNQGRKALKSAVSLHLENYSSLSWGWWPLESDQGNSAGNLSPNGMNAAISGLSFGTPDAAGTAALPGVAGIATLDEDASYFNASIQAHPNTISKETVLWFMRLPNLPASEILIANLYSTGTVRTWNIYVQNTGALHVIGKDRNGITVAEDTVAMWNGNADLPTGCWLACTLYLTIDGANVDWALNHHRPGSGSFWSCNGTYAGTVGIFTGVRFPSSAAHTTAGNLQLTQVMHYAGDFPFVDYNFYMAAQAYNLEEAAARALRLASNASVPMATAGLPTLSVQMGPQSPGKLTDLLEECAAADDGFIAEERDDYGLTFVTRQSLFNRETIELDIDAGHLTSPLDLEFDDQRTRNDVTVSRPSGSFRRVVQETGPLNIQAPEDDPDGVGIYDEQTTVNVGTDDLCGSHAAWRVSRGTLTGPRYPNFAANLRASAFQLDRGLAADVVSLEPGDHVLLVNTESDYIPRWQGVQSFVETLRDLYEWGIVYTAVPNDTRRVGVINYNSRVGASDLETAASFTAGTDTQLQVTSPTGLKMVTLADGDIHFPMEVEVSGVRLRVTMTGVVLNSNSTFETGTTGWTTVGGIAIAQDNFYSTSVARAPYNLRGTASGAGVAGAVADAAGAAPVTAGQIYRLSGWVRVEIASAALELAVDWYSSAPAFLSASVAWAGAFATGWTYITGTVTAPVSATTGRLRVSNTFAGATRIWMDALRVTHLGSEAGSTQILTVEQAPTNANFGVTGKVIPAGSRVNIVDAMGIGFGESQ